MQKTSAAESGAAVLWEMDGVISCDSIQSESEFELAIPWLETATNPAPRYWGDSCTLTWGLIADGITIPGSQCGSEPGGPSDLIAFMDFIHGSGPGGTDLTQRPWFPLFEQVFSAWGDLNGVEYVYEPIDDGSPFPTSAGVLGTRADVRIGGHFIDGEPSGVPNTVACNFFPPFGGDMIIDTSNIFVFTTPTNNYLMHRNVLSHEHGHGLGVRHSCPADNSKLMEPTLNTGFDGPQYDDVLASHRMYGDPLEFPTSPDDDQAGAIEIGDTAAVYGGRSYVRSIDDDLDVDWYSLSVLAPVTLTLSVNPNLPGEDEVYPAGPQNPDGSCSAGTPFNGRMQSDLGFDLYAPSGLLLESADNPGFGAEAIYDVPLVAETGNYTVKVYGDHNAAQRYWLYAATSCMPDAWEPDDDDWSFATGLVDGSTQTHSICPAWEHDWFEFYLNEPSAITIHTAMPDVSLTLIKLYDEFQTLIDQSYGFDVDRTCGVDELPPGLYYIYIAEIDETNPINSYDITLDATSCITEYQLSVATTGAGTGVVTSNPAGIDCGATCSAMFPRDAPVALTATPDTGSVFAGWSGDPDCSNGQVGMASALSCTATFDIETHTLTIATTGDGEGTVTSVPSGISCPGDCTEDYDLGQVVTITPTPIPGSVFGGWTGAADCSNNQVTMDTDVSCTATFSLPFPGSERDALIALYTATNGGSWGNSTNWKTPPLYTDGFAMPGTECTWHGVYCNGGETAVDMVLLGGNQLSGTIPPELGTLSNVTRLYLANNQLSGGLPPTLGGLSTLLELDVSNNQLDGGIPPEFAGLSSIEILVLDNNQLSGNLPAFLGGLLTLNALSAADNQLTGSIPPGLGTLTNMSFLNLSDNRLSGSIPSQLGGMSSMFWFFLVGNQLTGPVPQELTGLGVVPTTFDISYNALWADNGVVQAFLDSVNPGWSGTQTVAPGGVTITSATDRTVWLEWTPIAYDTDSGAYEVFSEESGNPGSVFAGRTQDKLATTFPVTALQPGQSYDFTASTFTRSHPNNQNTVVSEMGAPVPAVTTNTGCATPAVNVTGTSAPFTLTVTSAHDSFEWSTGETTSSIVVSPSAPGYYWVRAMGPGSCDEAAVVSPTILFHNGFESGYPSAWSSVVGMGP